MIEPLSDLPDGVIGFSVHGTLHSADYTGALVPAVEASLAAGHGVRLVLVFEDFSGLSGGGLAQDLKMGVEHLTRWTRTALVTDIDWMTHLVALFGWMSPGEFHTFPLAERDQAIAWAAA